jgi:type I restriction enzyme S subunit
MKAKFKDTEIGLIPVDWDVKKICQVAEVIGGGTPSTKVSDYWDGQIAWITPKDLSNFKFRLIKHGERNITKEGLKNSSAKLLPKGTVLLTTRAPVGYLAIADNEITTNQGFRSLIPNDKTTTEFVYYLLKKNVELLKSNATGTTFGELSGSTLKSLKLSFPPLSEQHAIAKILSDLDTKIELLQKQNETLEAIAQAIFKHWFVDFEFPNEEGKPYKSSGGEMVDSELGEIPKGWEVKTIGDVVTVKGGTTPSTKKQECWDNGTIHWCTPKDLSNLGSPVLLDTERKITNKGLATISSGLLPTGTVLLSSRAPIGYLAISEVPVSINQGFIAILCDKEVSNYYILHWVKFNLGTIKNMAGGSTFQEINKANFRIIKILVPSQDIMRDYNILLNKMHEGIVLNVKQSRILVEIRDAILPKLMSGKIRVPAEVE